MPIETDFLPDEYDLLQDYLAAENPFMDYIRATQIRFEPGVNIAGELLERLKAMWANADIDQDILRRLFAAPGDRTLDFGKDDVSMRVGLSLPIAYDIWYVMHTVNVLKFWFDDRVKEEYRQIDFVMEKMETFWSAIHEIRPMKVPEASHELTTATGTGGNSVGPATVYYNPGIRGSSMSEIRSYYVGNNDLYYIKEMRFETMLTGTFPQFPSPREKLTINHTVTQRYTKNTRTRIKNVHLGCTSSSSGKAYVDEPGFLAFPVGPLGVHEVLAIVTETMMGVDGLGGGSGMGSVEPFTSPSEPQAGNELLPPWDGQLNKAVGHHLLESTYQILDDEGVEYLAVDFDETEGIEPHRWLRYWLPRDYVGIIPGEFVALLVKPWPLHVWWFQETTPFVYAGNWMETEFYTSGVVKEIIEPWVDLEENMPSPPDQKFWDATKPGTMEDGVRYKVWVKNEEVVLKSSDFYEYEVGERVGILKKWWDTSDGGDDVDMGPAESFGQTQNFNWKHLELKNNDEDLETLVTDWVIVPVDFYPEA